MSFSSTHSASCSRERSLDAPWHRRTAAFLLAAARREPLRFPPRRFPHAAPQSAEREAAAAGSRCRAGPPAGSSARRWEGPGRGGERLGEASDEGRREAGVVPGRGAVRSRSPRTAAGLGVCCPAVGSAFTTGARAEVAARGRTGRAFKPESDKGWRWQLSFADRKAVISARSTRRTARASGGPLR